MVRVIGSVNSQVLRWRQLEDDGGSKRVEIVVVDGGLGLMVEGSYLCVVKLSYMMLNEARGHFVLVYVVNNGH